MFIFPVYFCKINCILISIHLMLMFISNIPPALSKLNYFNTSNVNVHPFIKRALQINRFYFNTSNVNVHQLADITPVTCSIDFNTSNVNVHPRIGNRHTESLCNFNTSNVNVHLMCAFIAAGLLQFQYI